MYTKTGVQSKQKNINTSINDFCTTEKQKLQLFLQKKIEFGNKILCWDDYGNLKCNMQEN